MDTTFKMENQVFNYRVAAVWIENGHVLLHKQTHESHWALPGGRAQMLEDSKTCLVREIKEELDAEAETERLLWVTENFFTYSEKAYHELGFYYAVKSKGGEQHYRSEPFFGPEGDHLTYQWVPLEEVQKVNLYPEFLREALNILPSGTEHLIMVDNKD
ncbi:ADP-ribose pyrophosphatase YjhB, NUDIX family [Planococcus glaciei]|uniref:NUDIX hydrolase n=1 Tax=Planococcus glaciei TaxID=459472 RepID=UPI0008832C6C|nr:NUDIX hydrolase [Planococcus glaciei]SDG68843.1 ADP-ribose pyrophosphatase YjhB, NUDIX family [Planococcus glaciei]